MTPVAPTVAVVISEDGRVDVASEPEYAVATGRSSRVTVARRME